MDNTQATDTDSSIPHVELDTENEDDRNEGINDLV